MKRLAKALKRKRTLDEKKSPSSSSTSGGLSLSSPITRLVAEQIGKGKPAHLLQKFANAAVEEAGAHNVSTSVLFFGGTVWICFTVQTVRVWMTYIALFNVYMISFPTSRNDISRKILS